MSGVITIDLLDSDSEADSSPAPPASSLTITPVPEDPPEVPKMAPKAVKSVSKSTESENLPTMMKKVNLSSKYLSQKKLLTTDDNFLENFDPDLSNRERKKLDNKIKQNETTKKTSSLYDDCGKLCCNGMDLCDCLEEKCPGCYFPCPKCRSNKCGVECRVNRKWAIEEVVSSTSSVIIYNKYIQK